MQRSLILEGRVCSNKCYKMCCWYYLYPKYLCSLWVLWFIFMHVNVNFSQICPKFFQAFIVLFTTFQNSRLFATLIEDDTRWWGQYAVLSAALRDRVVGSNSGGGSDRPSRGTPVKRAKWHLGKYFCTVVISESLNICELCSPVLLSFVATPLLQCVFKKLLSQMTCIGTCEHTQKKNKPRNLFYVFMQQGNLLHF